MMSEPGGRYRQRMAERRKRILWFLILVGGLCGFSYWWGTENVRSHETAYMRQASKLQTDRAEMEKTVMELRSEVESTQIRYKQLEEKYKQDAPSGALKQLTDQIRRQLDSGIQPSRLALAIESARPPKNCSEPMTKRFVMKTPVYSGPHGTVVFGNGAITVTGEGISAVGATGSPEAWYDPGKPVKIIFTQTGGQETVKTGLLPIQHSIIIASKEYRFTVAAGERSFISVTSDSCDYP